MNFAALAFIMEIDDIVVTADSYFALYQSKYNIFSDIEFGEDVIDEVGTLKQFCKSVKCLKHVRLSWFLILYCFVMAQTYMIVGWNLDFHAEGYDYMCKRYVVWENEEWFETIVEDKDYQTYM